MIIENLFSDNIPTLSITDSVDKALELMDSIKTSSLPIIDEEKFIGIITDDVLLDSDQRTAPLKKYKIEKEHTFIYSDQHIYDAIYQINQYKLSLLVVVNRDESYLGTISHLDLINAIGKIISVDQIGSILVLKMGTRDYSLSEIAQIAEDSQIKILSSYIQSCSDQLNIKVTLRLNSSDLTSFKLGLERYNYTIDSIFSENQILDDMYKSRLDELMHYLNI